MCIFLFLLLTASASYTTPPTEFLNKHILAVGGKERLEHLGSVERTGTIFFPDYGQPFPKGSGSYRTRIIYPDRVRIEIKVSTYQLDQIRNKDQYWNLEERSYKIIKDANLKEELATTSLRANREILWWSKEHNNIRLRGELPKGVNDANCIQGDRFGKTEFACFDRTTGFLNSYGTDQEFRVYSNWKSVNDLKFPFEIRQYKNGLLSYSIQLKTIKVNSTLKDSDFNPGSKDN